MKVAMSDTLEVYKLTSICVKDTNEVIVNILNNDVDVEYVSVYNDPTKSNITLVALIHTTRKDGMISADVLSRIAGSNEIAVLSWKIIPGRTRLLQLTLGIIFGRGRLMQKHADYTTIDYQFFSAQDTIKDIHVPSERDLKRITQYNKVRPSSLLVKILSRAK